MADQGRKCSIYCTPIKKNKLTPVIIPHTTVQAITQEAPTWEMKSCVSMQRGNFSKTYNVFFHKFYRYKRQIAHPAFCLASGSRETCVLTPDVLQDKCALEQVTASMWPSASSPVQWRNDCIMSSSASAHSLSNITWAQKKLEMALACEERSYKFSMSCLGGKTESGLYKDTKLPPNDSKISEVQEFFSSTGSFLPVSEFSMRLLDYWNSQAPKNPGFAPAFYYWDPQKGPLKISHLVYHMTWRCVSSSNRNCPIHRLGVETYIT